MGGRGGTSHRASGGGLPKTLARFAELQRSALARIGAVLSRMQQQYVQGQLQRLFAENDFGIKNLFICAIPDGEPVVLGQNLRGMHHLKGQCFKETVE